VQGLRVKGNIPIMEKDVWMPTLFAISKWDGIMKRSIKAF